MKIHIYSIMWNEEYLLPYFLRHYSLFADKIFIINDHSTDRTVEIAKANDKVTLLNFEYTRGLNEDDFNYCFSDLYKKYSRGVADWVMCVDTDELIYNKDMITNLENQHRKGVRIIKTTGYMMISRNLPQTDGQIYDQCGEGLRIRSYDKPVVFDPSLDITFGDGRHNIEPIPGIRPQKGKLTLLHYRYLSKEYFLTRSNNQFSRMDVTEEYKNYRIKRGLAYYNNALTMPLTKII